MTGFPTLPLCATALAIALAAAGPAAAQVPPPPPITENTPAWVAGLNPGGALSLRAGPGTAFARLGNLPPGAAISILARLGNWLYVDAGGVRGFISARYVSLSAPPPAPPMPAPGQPMRPPPRP